MILTVSYLQQYLQDLQHMHEYLSEVQHKGFTLPAAERYNAVMHTLNELTLYHIGVAESLADIVEAIDTLQHQVHDLESATA